MDRIIIRKYRQEDQAAVEEITYQTGFHGEDLTGRGYFDDRRLFFLVFIYYYARWEPEHFFVAVERESDRVEGFICGTKDTHTQERNYAKRMIARILARVTLVTFWRHPRTFMNLFKMLRILDAIDQDRMREISETYPAHLHINMRPGSQGLGIGGRLLRRFEDHLRAFDVCGLHLRTSNYNRKALPFYEKYGYRLVYATEVVVHPLLDDLRLLTFVKRL